MDGIPIEMLVQSSFSIGVSAFLLLRVERELKHLAAAIEQLRRCQVCKVGKEA